MILGEGVTAAAFFAYFLQLQAKSKGEIAGGQIGKPILPLIFWSFDIKTTLRHRSAREGQKKTGSSSGAVYTNKTIGPRSQTLGQTAPNKKALKINRLTRLFVIPAGFGLLAFIGPVYFVFI